MIRKSLLLALSLLIAIPLMAQFQAPRPSPAATVSQQVGITDITISYSRPGVKGREIWGGLVPYDKVWRTGANQSTRIELSRDVKINGHDLKAGTYSIHTIPTPGEWTIILNSVADPNRGWSYDEKNDVLRFKVQPKEHGFHERMTFVFPEVDDDSATLVLVWEKLMIPFEITVDTEKQVLENAEAELDNWVPTYQAANYAFGKGLKDKAAGWLKRSLMIRETYFNLSLKARMQADAGRKKEAVETAKKAVALGKEAGNNVSATEKLIAEWMK